MQKKIRKVMSVFMVSALLFSGCGIHGTDNVKKEEDNENNNIVKLTVWSEKDNVDTTSKMVESFKEYYKDEAQFDITIDVQADAKVRDVMLTDVHNGADVFSFPDDQLTSLVAYEKHTRELRTVRNYTRGRKNKSEFEKEFLGLYPKFEEQASEILESLREQEGKKEGMGICHGDFNQHNIVFRSEYAAVISFDNICYDVQIGDLARFMRKILEKNNWNMGLGMEMIRAYSDKKAMSPYETKQLYLRLAYPEKFWKIANHYYNANKAWGFGRYLEKLEKIKAEEENREQFLAYMKRFAYS